MLGHPSAANGQGNKEVAGLRRSAADDDHGNDPRSIDCERGARASASGPSSRTGFVR